MLKQTDGVVTVVQSGGLYQVVIGQQVGEVYDAVIKAGHLERLAAPSEEETETGENKNIVAAVLLRRYGNLCSGKLYKPGKRGYVQYDQNGYCHTDLLHMEKMKKIKEYFGR